MELSHIILKIWEFFVVVIGNAELSNIVTSYTMDQKVWRNRKCVINVQRDVNVAYLLIWKKFSAQRGWQSKKNHMTFSRTDWSLNRHCMEHLLCWPYKMQPSQPLSEDGIVRCCSFVGLTVCVTCFSNEARSNTRVSRERTARRAEDFDNTVTPTGYLVQFGE
jgi:hypothetical protein